MTELDQATARWAKAQSDLRYWQKQVKDHEFSVKAIDRLRMAERELDRAISHRARIRENINAQANS